MLGLHLLTVVVLAGMVWLGFWQLGVFHEHQRADAASVLHQRPVPLPSLLGPDAAFPDNGTGRPVTVTGSYAAHRQFLIPRRHEGRSGSWVLTPLLVAGPQQSRSAVLVVRGWTPDRTAPPAPTGPVRVTGALEPSQNPGPSAVSVGALIGRVPFDLYSGYVVLTDQRPPAAPGLAPVAPPPPPVSVTSGLRNLVYAIQWWVFAAFAVFMWWRIVTEQTGARPPSPPPSQPPSAPDAEPRHRSSEQPPSRPQVR